MGALAISEKEKAERLLAKKNNPEYNQKRRASYKKQNEKKKKKDVFVLLEPISLKGSISNELINMKDNEREEPEVHREVNDIIYAADLDEREGVVYDSRLQKGQYIRKKY